MERARKRRPIDASRVGFEGYNMSGYPYMASEIDYKLVVQKARKDANPKILSYLRENEVEPAREFLKKLDEPLFSRWLSIYGTSGRLEGITSVMTTFTPPSSLDPLVNTTLQALTDEFLNYLEKKRYVVVEFGEKTVTIHSFEKIDLSESFREFIEKEYDDAHLLSRWELIKATYGVKEYPDRIPLPKDVRRDIIESKLSLEIENAGVGFGDDAKEHCMFCGRVGCNYPTVTGFADFSSQRPQKRFETDIPRVCPVCAFSVYVSIIRTTRGAGQMQSHLIALKTTRKEEPFEYVFDRILGVGTGGYLSLADLVQKEERFGKSALTQVVASKLPLNVLVDKDFNLKNLSTNTVVDTNKCIAVKVFESILGYDKIWRPDDEEEYRKAHYSILRSDYFSLFKHLGMLLRNKGSRGRVTLDNGIYQLVKYEVIEMEDRPDIVFGTALLIDAFMPNIENEDVKTQTRKVVFYLEKPEEVLLRLREMIKEDYATLRADFTNKAQFKLLKDLLVRIHDEEGYGRFEQEQQERKQLIEKKAGVKYSEGERLFLQFDDLLKVYLYIQRILSQEYGKNPRKLQKSYSDLMNRIKYALVARRPELVQRGE